MMKCRRGLDVKPLKSAAGWYWGTLTPDGFPNCRISTMYADTEEECLQIPCGDRWYAMEVEYCNNGKGCFRNANESQEDFKKEYEEAFRRSIEELEKER